MQIKHISKGYSPDLKFKIAVHGGNVLLRIFPDRDMEGKQQEIRVREEHGDFRRLIPRWYTVNR